jgi:hypothetical protein
MSLRDVVGKNKFLAENVFLAAPKTVLFFFLAAPKTNSWLPEKCFPGCPKNKFHFSGCPKNIFLAENVFLAAPKTVLITSS